MNTNRIIALLILPLLLASIAFADISKSALPYRSTIDNSKENGLTSHFANLQMPFIKNESQLKDKQIKYYANTFIGTTYITDKEIIYALNKSDNSKQKNWPSGRAIPRSKKDKFRRHT